MHLQENTILFQLEDDAVWANGGDNGADHIELSGFGTCSPSPCILSPTPTASPVATGAAATLKFLANSSRMMSPRRPVVGGRFVVSYSHAPNARRHNDAQTDFVPEASQFLRTVSDDSLSFVNNLFLRISMTDFNGGEPPCAFTYGPDRSVVRLGLQNITTQLEGSWTGTTFARAFSDGLFALVSAGQCLSAAAGGPGQELMRGAVPDLETCATKCIGYALNYLNYLIFCSYTLSPNSAVKIVFKLISSYY